MNAFVTALAGLCAERPLDEKRLIAPSRRIGNQWLDAAARAGHPALNVRVETLHSLAVDLASTRLARDGLTVAPRRAEELLVGRLLRDLLPGRLRYLRDAASGPGLASSVLVSLAALRVQHVPDSRLRAGVFKDPGKAADLRLIVGEYGRLLEAEGLADYARVLLAAAERLAEDPEALGRDALVLVPSDFEPNGLERRLLGAVPAGRLLRLDVDPPGLPGEVRFACAVGEGNEVRAVLRWCLERGIPLDEVEVLHTDPAYVTTFVEACAALDRPGAAGRADAVIDAPVTFAEGIPCILSRPGRALHAWLRWMAEGYHQAPLVAMLREGLLRTGEPGGAGRPGFGRLAELLRSIPVGRERGRYLEKIEERLRAARALLAAAAGDQAPDEGDDEARGEESPEQRRERLGRRVAETEALRGIVAGLLEVSPADDAPAAVLVAEARRFLESCARSTDRLDNFAAERLSDELEEMENWLGRAGAGPPQDVRAWLEAMPAEIAVGGSGPRAGCLHVDRMPGGGHTGRSHTFVIGLDDGRFPGAGLQDPLLLDGERRRLDEAMPTAASRLEENVRDFRRLLGRLRGSLTLSWPSRAVVEDADRAPSQAVLDVFRQVRDAPEAGLEDLLAAAGPPASFAPETGACALDPDEWRLWRFTTDETVANAGEVLERHAPHLARGRAAAAERAGTSFTAWDGRVPAAGAALDPASPTGIVLSSNGLETAGACPRRFFYRYALAIEPPDELAVDPSRWLDAPTSGSLLHELFEEFVREILRVGRYADVERARDTIHTMLERKLEDYRSRYPVPSMAVYVREREQLVTAADTFVREERQHVLETGSEPVYLEASFGLPPGGHATALDHPDPVPVELPDGRTIRTRGRVDRIDHRAVAAGGWAIWDYKTGGTWGYDRADPFPEGRKIQPYVYLRMVERRLRESVDRGAEVRSFGYFFPGARGKGERLAWERARLAGGGAVLAELCAIIAGGAFAATTDDRRDCAWCDYRRACGDTAAQAAATRRKVLSGEPLLAGIGRLRAKSLGRGGEDEGGGK
jgi:ATP-dependent helicase/nuclease subunit B